MLRLRHGGGKPVKYEYTLTDVCVQLSPSHSTAVAWTTLCSPGAWQPRKVESKRARVVEQLDQMTGELSRTAKLVAQTLSMPCTLYRHTAVGKWELADDDGGRWDTKLCSCT